MYVERAIGELMAKPVGKLTKAERRIKGEMAALLEKGTPRLTPAQIRSFMNGRGVCPK